MEPHGFSKEELQRYDRQVVLPEFGVDGQKKLSESSILIVGCGGLGSPAAVYLASAGVGTIGLVDYDKVDISNLHRQILFTEKDVGKNKAEAGKARLAEINPHIVINTYPDRFSLENATSLIADYDMVLDGTDNFATRYLINDVCVQLNKKNVHAAIYRFEGQLSVFCGNDNACYRCLFPEPPPPESVPSCAEAGVLGVLPGLLGTMQALEAIKVLTGIGDALHNRLVIIDTLSMRQNMIQVSKDPNCPICGQNPSIVDLKEIPMYCEVESDSISAQEWIARNKSDHILLDVREAYEYQASNLDGLNIPLGELGERIDEIPRDEEVIVHCASGKRSAAAASLLREMGFAKVFNLEGGIAAVHSAQEQHV